ncbi:MAG: hypothetical protein SVW02_02465 [Candidatus Nanohaloarchaea archaeon]|nr:hypothetical protein [Candidatus Nanohaloarchaea archaeon]
MKVLDAAELGTGSTVLVAGLGVSAFAANQENFPGVFFGFALFIAGYKLSQIAVRDSEATEFQETVADMLEGARLIDLLMTLVGIGTIAYGFILLFEGFRSTDLVLAFTASALLFLGYAVAHYGVNRTVV